MHFMLFPKKLRIVNFVNASVYLKLDKKGTFKTKTVNIAELLSTLFLIACT